MSSNVSFDFDKWEAEQLTYMEALFTRQTLTESAEAIASRLPGGTPSENAIFRASLTQIEEHIVTLQGNLALWRTLDSASSPLTTAWLALDHASKRQTLRKALIELVATDTLNKSVRVFCPEVTIDGLMKDEGLAFLRFFEAVAIRGSGASVYYMKGSELWGLFESLSPSSTVEHRLAMDVNRANRQRFLCMFAHAIMLDLIDKVSPVEFLQPLFTGVNLNDNASDPSMDSRRICSECSKSESSMVGGQLLCCGRCKSEAGRNVFYCSRECQTKAWKSGHKKQCGKTLDANAAAKR